ncbi:MAG: hypothetical protein COA79_21345 [Planctomycetota bacterium]|nr:MAG: hypothetical protein COA79_21345 [Planctomycetota bacterium]
MKLKYLGTIVIFLVCTGNVFSQEPSDAETQGAGIYLSTMESLLNSAIGFPEIITYLKTDVLPKLNAYHKANKPQSEYADYVYIRDNTVDNVIGGDLIKELYNFAEPVLGKKLNWVDSNKNLRYDPGEAVEIEDLTPNYHGGGIFDRADPPYRYRSRAVNRSDTDWLKERVVNIYKYNGNNDNIEEEDQNRNRALGYYDTNMNGEYDNGEPRYNLSPTTVDVFSFDFKKWQSTFSSSDSAPDSILKLNIPQYYKRLKVDSGNEEKDEKRKELQQKIIARHKYFAGIKGSNTNLRIGYGGGQGYHSDGGHTRRTFLWDDMNGNNTFDAGDKYIYGLRREGSGLTPFSLGETGDDDNFFDKREYLNGLGAVDDIIGVHGVKPNNFFILDRNGDGHLSDGEYVYRKHFVLPSGSSSLDVKNELNFGPTPDIQQFNDLNIDGLLNTGGSAIPNSKLPINIFYSHKYSQPFTKIVSERHGSNGKNLDVIYVNKELKTYYLKNQTFQNFNKYEYYDEENSHIKYSGFLDIRFNYISPVNENYKPAKISSGRNSFYRVYEYDYTKKILKVLVHRPFGTNVIFKFDWDVSSGYFSPFGYPMDNPNNSVTNSRNTYYLHRDVNGLYKLIFNDGILHDLNSNFRVVDFKNGIEFKNSTTSFSIEHLINGFTRGDDFYEIFESVNNDSRYKLSYALFKDDGFEIKVNAVRPPYFVDFDDFDAFESTFKATLFDNVFITSDNSFIVNRDGDKIIYSKPNTILGSDNAYSLDMVYDSATDMLKSVTKATISDSTVTTYTYVSATADEYFDNGRPKWGAIETISFDGKQQVKFIYDQYGRVTEVKSPFKDVLEGSVIKNIYNFASYPGTLKYDEDLYIARPTSTETSILGTVINKTFFEYDKSYTIGATQLFPLEYKIKTSKDPSTNYGDLETTEYKQDKFQQNMETTNEGYTNVTTLTLGYVNQLTKIGSRKINESTISTDFNLNSVSTRNTEFFNNVARTITPSTSSGDSTNLKVEGRTGSTLDISNYNWLDQPGTIKKNDILYSVKYDLFGNPTELKSLNSTVTIDYDVIGNVAEQTEVIVTPDLSDSDITKTYTYKYDARGRVTESKNILAGWTTSYLYNDTTEKVTVSFNDLTTDITEFYLDGKVKKKLGTSIIPTEYDHGVTGSKYFEEITSGSQTRKACYDAYGNLCTTEQGGTTGPLVTYGYNALNQIDDIVYKHGPHYKILYNENGRRESVESVGETGSPTQMVTFDYSTTSKNSKKALLITTTLKGGGGVADIVTTKIVTDDGKESYSKINNDANKEIHTLFERSENSKEGTVVTTTSPSGTKIIATNDIYGSKTELKSNGSVLDKVETSGDYQFRTNSLKIAGQKGSSVTYKDKNDFLDSVIGSDNSSTQINTDDNGKYTGTTFPNNRSQSTTINDRGEVTAESGYGINVYTLEYHTDGTLNKLNTFNNSNEISKLAKTITEFVTDPGTRLPIDKKIAGNSTGTVTYEDNIRVKTITDANGNTSTFNYFASNGTLQSIVNTGPNGNRTYTYTYDVMGRVSSLHDSSGSVTTNYTYNADGQFESETIPHIPNAKLVYEYDIYGRIMKSEIEVGSTRVTKNQITYDGDRLEAIIDDAITTKYNFIAGEGFINDVQFIKVADDIVTFDFTKDDASRLGTISVKVNNGATEVEKYSYLYNSLNQITSITDDLGATGNWTYLYDDFMQLKQADRSGSDPLSYVYKYDSMGNRTFNAETIEDTKNSYVSNNLNQYTFRRIENNLEICGSADADVTVTVNGMASERFGASNESFRVVIPTPKIPGITYQCYAIRVIGTRYDSILDQDEIAKIEGEVGFLSGEEVLNFDGNGAITQNDSFIFDRDEGGRINFIEPKEFVARFPYLNTDDTVTVSGSDHQVIIHLDALDGDQNISYISFIDTDNSTSSYLVEYYDTTSTTWEDVTTVGSPIVDDDQVIIEFNTENTHKFRITDLTSSDNLNAVSIGDKDNRLAEPQIKTVYEYDHQGRRITSKEYDHNGTGWNTSPIKTTKFAWDGWLLIAEFDGADAIQKSYTWGRDNSGSIDGAGGVQGLIGIHDHITGKHYIPTYHNMNVSKLIDIDDGTVVAEYEYSPFGSLLKKEGVAKDINPFLHHTKYYDERYGLYYYGYRYYDPSSGRWLSREPLGEGASLNLYRFAGNDPVNRFDYLGLDDKNKKNKKVDDSKLLLLNPIAVPFNLLNLVWSDNFISNYGKAVVDGPLIAGIEGLKSTVGLGGVAVDVVAESPGILLSGPALPALIAKGVGGKIYDNLSSRSLPENIELIFADELKAGDNSLPLTPYNVQRKTVGFIKIFSLALPVYGAGKTAITKTAGVFSKTVKAPIPALTLESELSFTGKNIDMAWSFEQGIYVESKGVPLLSAPNSVPQNTISIFRKHFSNSNKLDNFKAFDGSSASGTAAFVEINGIKTFGVNGKLSKSSLELRQQTFAQIQETTGLHAGGTLNKMQALSHAEGIALQRAFVKNGGVFPASVVIYVDRETCRFCKSPNGLSRLKKLYGIKNLIVIDSEGKIFIVP